ncbi:hypothetical protein GCM10025886_13490 [Tetragenococcus halophilus subsp. flandriensis]|uniref:helix-turn-helix domain-containing protein n=1 Tax=Tetragenococcus halophilus TaxID=51669 RepID=UPI0023E99A9A|nr:helix-turn-helix transcriptional regulator [Tetragenococcus halophilus]GMA08198.1 hypothetical protein GCM10025886_13490 [Tetragenococcus halophilus subsp. flandriensis]
MNPKQIHKISKHVARYRKKAKLSQQDVADKVGLSQHHIGLLENGQRQWTLETFIKVTSAIGIDLTTFFLAFEQEDEDLNQLIQNIEHSSQKEVFIKAFNEILKASEENKKAN